MIDFEKLPEPYFIAEIGINHNGDLQIAKRLIDAAFACGWDCVKFQKRTPDICVPESQKNIPRDTPWGRLTYLEYRKRIEFGPAEYDAIDAYCRQKPIAWTSSVWDAPSLEFVVRYGPPFLKIPSAHMTNVPLIEAAVRTGIPLIVSTGMSTLDEVDQCVRLLKKRSVSFALMHTNSSYPSPEDEINLNVIITLRQRYGCTVGYSGHEYGLEPSVLAVALGASIIERHVTLDHDMWGTDQKASLEIEGMEKLVRRAKGVKRLLGTREKTVTFAEAPCREKLKGR